jgi:integrase
MRRFNPQFNYLEQASELLRETEAMKYSLRKGDYDSPFFYVNFRIEGKRHNLSTKETIKSKAKIKALEIIREKLSKRKFPQSFGSHTFQDSVNRFISERGVITKEDQITLNWFIEQIGDMKIGLISKDIIWKLKRKRMSRINASTGMPVKPQTINRVFNIFHSVLNKCEQWDWLDHAPLHQRLKESRPLGRKSLNNDQIKRLIEASLKLGIPHMGDIILFLRNTGLRKSELLSLKKSNLLYDGDAIGLDKQKNGEFNEVYFISSQAKKIAIKHSTRKSEDEHLFNITNFRGKWEKIRDVARIETDIHSLRHTAITEVAKKIDSPYKLKQFSRHKTDAALKRYIHLTEKDLKETSAFAEIKDILV